jgi:signal transduction histidine kinase
MRIGGNIIRVAMQLPSAVSGLLARLGMSSRAVLYVGFGSLLGLMILAAVSANRALDRIEASSGQIRHGFLQRDELLNRMRSDLYRTSIDLRDYLLHADDELAARRRTEIQRTFADIDAGLRQYRKDASPRETPTIDKLQHDVASYFALVDPVLGWDAATRHAQGADYLRTRLFPRRQELLQFSDRIREMDARQLDFGESDVADVFSSFRREVIVVTALTTLFGLALALFSIGRVQSVEAESETRYREVAQAREELHRLSARLVQVQEEERRKLSRELHDEVGQSMSALLVELGNLASTLPPENAALNERMQSLKRLAENNVVVLRNLSLLLRPSMLDDLGLTPALKWQAREVARRTGVKIKVHAEDAADDLPDEYRTCIFRVVQEALHNVTRHSKATQVSISVTRNAQGVSVRVQDNGSGFHTQDKGMGILGMEERVRHLHGSFHVESHPGEGTTIAVHLPLAPAEVLAPAGAGTR